MKKTLYLITPLARHFPVDLKADYVGIDAGIERILECGLPVFRALGDFDSVMDQKDIPEEAVVFPAEKDWPDSELAMNLALDLDHEFHYRKIVLWGGISGRLDHTFANLRLIAWSYPEIVLQDEKQKAFALLPGRHVIHPEYRHISFFAMEPSCISLENLKYPLSYEKIDQKSVLTLSNSFIDQKDAVVTVHSGRFLCIESQYE